MNAAIIVDSMVRALFACAWSDAHGEAERAAYDGGTAAEFALAHGSLAGCEIFDVMPRSVDPAAVLAARTLRFDMEQANGVTLDALYARVADRISADDFGHYAAMQALLHGVGLLDYGISREMIAVPSIEFGAHSLTHDYFP